MKKRIGIIGGAGYTAGELIRLLINHPDVEIAFVNSSSNAGRCLWEVHEGLMGETDMRFSNNHPLDEIDLLFLCTAHGDSRKFWEENTAPETLRVIDLAQDYRDETEGYIYGLPELNCDRIASASKIANPGCFATAIQLSLLPLASAQLLPHYGDVNITALTGSTGAGVKPSSTTHFSWRDNNISVYKAFTHQHLKEIGMNLERLQPDHGSQLNFVPVRGDFPRGIFAVVTLGCDLQEDDAKKLYNDYYADAPFTVVTDSNVDLKQAVNTNKAILNVSKHGNKLLVICALDNLLKGASGQAVENMNIMFGFDRRAGLRLKASAF